MREVRVLVTLQVEECNEGAAIDREIMEDAAVDAVENAVKCAADNGFSHLYADELCVGFVDAVLYEECDDDAPPQHRPLPRQKCVRVEYDLSYTGGDYHKVGDFTYVPLKVIDAVRGGLTDDERLKAAFRATTGYDPIHVVHYTFDQVYDENGNPWDED